MSRNSRIQQRIAEAIDNVLYQPLKRELACTDTIHSLGIQKERLKDAIEQIIDDEVID